MGGRCQAKSHRLVSIWTGPRDIAPHHEIRRQSRMIRGRPELAVTAAENALGAPGGKPACADIRPLSLCNNRVEYETDLEGSRRLGRRQPRLIFGALSGCSPTHRQISTRCCRRSSTARHSLRRGRRELCTAIRQSKSIVNLRGESSEDWYLREVDAAKPRRHRSF